VANFCGPIWIKTRWFFDILSVFPQFFSKIGHLWYKALLSNFVKFYQEISQFFHQTFRNLETWIFIISHQLCQFKKKTQNNKFNLSCLAFIDISHHQNFPGKNIKSSHQFPSRSHLLKNSISWAKKILFLDISHKIVDWGKTCFHFSGKFDWNLLLKFRWWHLLSFWFLENGNGINSIWNMLSS
jgi:hypothetical protein